MRRKKTLGCGRRAENNWINGWNERQGQKGEPGSNNNQKVVIKDEPDRKQRENRKTYTKKYEEITPEIFTGRQPAWQPKKRTISEKLSRTIEIIMTIY